MVVESLLASSSSWTEFKKAQHRFKRQADKPADYLGDFDEFVDFGNPTCPGIERVMVDTDAGCDSYQGPVFRLDGYPGFLYAPQALSTCCQMEMAHAAVTTYCERPHPTNIELVPPKKTEIQTESKRMWDTWKQHNGYLSTSDKPDDGEYNRMYRSFRKLSWATMGYNYDWTVRAYHDKDRSPIPPDLERIAKRFAATSLRFLGSNSTKFTGSACIVNYYNAKSLMGGHRDDSEFAMDKPIVSLSVGRPAVFLLGGSTRDDPVVPILVRPGDVMMMGGSTRFNYHAMARLLPPVLPRDVDSRHLPTADEQIRSLSQESRCQVPESELPALKAFLSQYRININLRQVFPDPD